MNAQVKISPIKLFEVTFPDGTSEIMEVVDRWPEGLSRMRDNNGNVLVISRERDEGSTTTADVVSAAKGFDDRLNSGFLT